MTLNHCPDAHPEAAEAWGPPDLVGIAAPVRITSGSDVAAMVPYLLGFHPTRSVVVLVFEGDRLSLTARFGLDYCAHPAILGERLRRLRSQFPDAQYVLAGYADEPAQASEAVGIVEELLGEPEAVVDCLIIDAHRYWSLKCASAGCCPPEGRSYDAAGSSAAVQAVVAGMQALSSRESLDAAIRPPKGGAARAARRQLDEASGWIAGSDPACHREFVARLLTATADVSTVAAKDLARLALLMNNPAMRDVALRELTRSNAARQVGLWQRVARVTPRDRQGPVLGMVGVSAWVDGNGALAAVCLERAERSKIWHPLLEILSQVNRLAAPPTLWDQLRADIIDNTATA